MKALFITATGTGMGKTLVTCALARHLLGRGKTVTALKPLVSGYDWDRAQDSDPHLILEALGEPITPEAVDAISPWRYTAPLAPDAAARREGREVDFDALVTFCREAMDSAADRVLIEGIGGAFVPLAGDRNVADWIAALDIPCILVAGNYLGALSHTISVVEAMRGRGLTVARLVINDCGNGAMALQETAVALAPFLDGVPVTLIPHLEPARDLWKKVDTRSLSDLE